MKRQIILATFVLLPLFSFAQYDSTPTLSEEQERQVKLTTLCWMEEMFKTDITQAMQLSDVPFAFDSEKVIYTKDELKQAFLEIFEYQGKRPLPKMEIADMYYLSEIKYRCIPLNYVLLLLKVTEDEEDTHEITIGVKITADNEYKVIGFDD